VSPSGALARGVVASAPGRLALAGAGSGPRLSVALDRRASCRVETVPAGVVIESKDSLTTSTGGDVAELLARMPDSPVAHVLHLLGSPTGLRVVTEWKLPQGSGVDGDSALAVATTAALAHALGRAPQEQELLETAREAVARAGRTEEHGFHAALWGGVVLTRGGGPALYAERLDVDPGRIDESLMLVDAGEAPAVGADTERRPDAKGDAALPGRIGEALAGGRYEDVVALLAEESDTDGALGGTAQRRVALVVRGAGGAARPLRQGRLVAVWAPPGAHGPGRREAVQAALQAAGLKSLPVRMDLRGLELE